MPKDYRAEDEADKFADIQHNRHRDCGRLGREEVDARDARELRARIEEQEEHASGDRLGTG